MTHEARCERTLRLYSPSRLALSQVFLLILLCKKTLLPAPGEIVNTQ